MQTIGNVLDGLIQRLANSPASPVPSGKLPLRPTPLRHHWPHKPRELSQIDPGLRAAISRAVSGQDRWPLVLLGSIGCGKTSAALCLLDHLAGAGRGFYFGADDFNDEWIDAEQGRLFTERKHEPVPPARLWREVAGSALVVLDEVCSTPKVSDHHYRAVKKILDLREGRPLLVISNKDLETIARVYDERVGSRLAEGTVHALNLPDRRIHV